MNLAQAIVFGVDLGEEEPATVTTRWRLSAGELELVEIEGAWVRGVLARELLDSRRCPVLAAAAYKAPQRETEAQHRFVAPDGSRKPELTSRRVLGLLRRAPATPMETKAICEALRLRDPTSVNAALRDLRARGYAELVPSSWPREWRVTERGMKAEIEERKP